MGAAIFEKKIAAPQNLSRGNFPHGALDPPAPGRMYSDLPKSRFILRGLHLGKAVYPALLIFETTFSAPSRKFVFSLRGGLTY